MKRSCAWAATPANASSSDEKDAAGDYHGSSPSRKLAASGEAGCLRNRSAGARSTSRPWCRNRISSPSRCACPRLCVTSTIFVPAACKREDDVLDLVGRARVEARGRLVEEKDLRAQRPHPRQREALLLAARQHACRRGPPARRGRPCAAPPARAPRAASGERRHSFSAYVTLPSAVAPQQHGSLEHHRLPPRPARQLRRIPCNRSRGGLEQPVAQPQQHALARAVGPEDHRARPGVERRRDATDDAARPDRELDVVEAQRQQRERCTHIHAVRHPYRRCAVSLTT